MAKAVSLMDDVLSRVREMRSRQVWWQKLPPEVLTEILAVRERFKNGELGGVNPTQLATAMVESLEARGIAMPKPRQVMIWLSEKSPTT